MIINYFHQINSFAFIKFTLIWYFLSVIQRFDRKQQGWNYDSTADCPRRSCFPFCLATHTLSAVLSVSFSGFTFHFGLRSFRLSLCSYVHYLSYVSEEASYLEITGLYHVYTAGGVLWSQFAGVV